MKKMLLMSAAVCLMTVAVQAQTKAAAPAKLPIVQKQTAQAQPQAQAQPTKKVCKKASPYDIFQLGLWFDQPTDTKYTDVFGLKVGAPICSGDASVYGIETAVICGATREVNGLSACILWSDVEVMNGIQFSIVNIAKKCTGLQLSVVNYAEDSSFQLGILNYNKNGFLPWFPVINFSVK